jgi:hypothetical protein
VSIAHSDITRNNEVDEYITPYELAQAVVWQIPPMFSSAPRVLDAGANSGVWGKAVREAFPDAYIIGVELMDMPNPGWYNEWYSGTDFLTFETEPCQLGTGNPPYSSRLTGKRKTIVDSFIKHSLELLEYGAPLYQLLRTNFAHAKGRWNKNGVLSYNNAYEEWKCMPRPSFYAEDQRIQRTSTNTHDYSVYVFVKGQNYPYTRSFPLMWKKG